MLLAEDNRVNQKVATRMLEKAGHDVTVAENGRVALETLASCSFDLLLLDIQMPEMDGFETIREIRRREHGSDTHLPVVALTAHARARDRDRCLAEGMDDFMTKPVRSRVLEETLDRVLRKLGAAREDEPEKSTDATALAPEVVIAS